MRPSAAQPSDRKETVSFTDPAYPRDLRAPHAGRARGARISLVLVPLACVALSACGGSSKPARSATTSAAAAASTTTPPATPSTAPAPAPTQTTQATTQTTQAPPERAALLRFLNCMRRHGIHMPEPDAAGHVSLRGLHVKSRRYQTVGSACLSNSSK